jgi:hypothetical protein
MEAANSDHFPAGHGWQAVLLMALVEAENLPAVHGVQLLAPKEDDQDPAAQSLHVLEDVAPVVLE